MAMGMWVSLGGHWALGKQSKSTFFGIATFWLGSHLHKGRLQRCGLYTCMIGLVANMYCTFKYDRFVDGQRPD